MNARIGRATKKDALELSKLECACYDISWHPYALWVWRRALDIWWVVKATDRGKIIGGAAALATSDPKTIYLDSIFVHPKYRGGSAPTRNWVAAAAPKEPGD